MGSLLLSLLLSLFVVVVVAVVVVVVVFVVVVVVVVVVVALLSLLLPLLLLLFPLSMLLASSLSFPSFFVGAEVRIIEGSVSPPPKPRYHCDLSVVGLAVPNPTFFAFHRRQVSTAFVAVGGAVGSPLGWRVQQRMRRKHKCLPHYESSITVDRNQDIDRGHSRK